ncbi:MAG: sarcosine oxidase subunit gamma family protein [Pseudomonadota bacterium]
MLRITDAADKSLAATPLAGLAQPADLAVRIEEAPLAGMITLKGDLEHPTLRAVVAEATGLEVPGIRKASLGEEGAVLWMAPDELLLIGPYDSAPDAAARLDADLAEAGPRLVEVVSDARARFRLIGSGAREVLAKGAPIDLHPSVFGVGDLRRTRLSHVAVGFWQTAAAPETFELVCFRSYARYAWEWLTASAEPGALPGVLE